jgi:phenylpropionate dioxygenase-like ring-hydroxylating dioxygenase large terminal subunit
MFSKADTELLTRIGPDTSLGALVRRYWIPALLLGDVAEPNGDPVRVRLVGENFIAWRDANGKLGFFDEYCPHRGASLALGHAEGDGLRCLYHGWKFATDGTILETPNCKSANFRERLKANVYPLREAGGLLWVYLGPKDKQPPFPHYKFFDHAPEDLAIYRATFDCNFVQMMEGTIDPAHPHMLHQDDDKLGRKYIKGPAKAAPGMQNYTKDVVADSFESADLAPECEVDDMAFGVQGVAIHEAIANGKPAKYARVHTWVLPFMAVPDPNAYVINIPIDDEHTLFLAVTIMPNTSAADREAFLSQLAGPASLYDGLRYRMGEAERWGQDRARMKHSFTGVLGVATEDAACTLSMGPIYDRSREHLVPADQLVVRMRRRMLQVAQELQSGKEPYMLTPEESRRLGAGMSLLSDPAKWRETMAPDSIPLRFEKKRA